MKKIFTKEVVIGLVTIVSLFILYSGINYLKGINILKPSNHYYVKMSNVAELQVSSPIYVDGFKVGLVNAIDYNYNSVSPENIVVQISLDKQMKIQDGSYVELKAGLTSGAYLDLVLNKYVSAYHQIGDTIIGRAEIGMMDKLSKQILPQVENILPRLDSILLGIQTLVNHPALSQSLDNIEATTLNLQKSTTQLNTLLSGDVPVIVSNLNKISSDFTVVSNNMAKLDFEKTLTTVNRTIENIDQMTMKINSPNGSLGLLLNDRSLYDNLDSTAKNAALLFEDIRVTPKKYVHFSLF
ncbi:phospholipid/cholesterol/gamma-HCH transport system substrate-binding protein [Dysgonomonadaceae bacterium PH5-43]|nr:phospholipid/cholesterol/gamma-HCH transport system substrate-binding protein [Dysgonomonadaceae bacterium PH5-43]